MKEERQTSDYYLELYADPSGLAGHFSVRVVGPDGATAAYGKYPKGDGDGEAMNSWEDIRGAVSGPAEILDDSERADKPGVHKGRVELSKEGAEKAKAFLENAKNNPGDYNLLSSNCVDFAQAAIDAAGSDEKIADQFKKEDLDKMGLLPLGAGDKAQWDAENAQNGGGKGGITLESVSGPDDEKGGGVPENSPFRSIINRQRQDDQDAGRLSDASDRERSFKPGEEAGLAGPQTMPAKDNGPVKSNTMPNTMIAEKDESPDAARIKKLLGLVEGDPLDRLDDLLLLRADQITKGQADAPGRRR